MDGIQALAAKAKTNPAVNAGVAANDDGSVTGAFAALLDVVGARFKSTDTGATMDSKLIRNDDVASHARADDARDAVKTRDDNTDDRTTAKPKAGKSRSDEDDDTKADDTKTAADSDDTQDSAASAQAADDQVSAQVAAAITVDVPLLATETVAPILIAQQVQTTVDPTAVQQTAVEAVATVADAAAIDPQAVVVASAATAQKAVTVEAPTALQNAAEVAGPTFKQAVVEAAGPAQNETAQETATPTVKAEATATDAKDNTQTTVTTLRSAAAQAQSQDMSRQVGPDTKAQVHVTVNGQGAAQTASAGGAYDIYAGYNGAQASTANGQIGVDDAGNALVGTKTPAEAAQAPVASPASPALAPQPQTPATQQGTSTSAVRSDVAAPAATPSGGASSGQTSFGESAFGSAGSNTQTNATTAGTPTTTTERPLATAQQIIDQIKVNITRAAKAGLDKITIQLKPVELGRIEVKLEMSEDHKVRVTVTADSKDTLALLQNDSRTLERTLNDAGLRTDTSNLHFNLRSESDAQTASDGKNGGNNAAADAGATDDTDEIAMTYDYTEAARARGGIDTFA